MKKSKVIRVHERKEWDGPKGRVYYCKCEMENGDKIEIGKKKPIKEGWEISYEITGDEDQYEFVKAKSVFNAEVASKKASAASDGNTNLDDSILFQVCLKSIVELMSRSNPATFSTDEIAENAFDLAVKSKQKIKDLGNDQD